MILQRAFLIQGWMVATAAHKAEARPELVVTVHPPARFPAAMLGPAASAFDAVLVAPPSAPDGSVRQR